MSKLRKIIIILCCQGRELFGENRCFKKIIFRWSAISMTENIFIKVYVYIYMCYICKVTIKSLKPPLMIDYNIHFYILSRFIFRYLTHCQQAVRQRAIRHRMVSSWKFRIPQFLRSLQRAHLVRCLDLFKTVNVYV